MKLKSKSFTLAETLVTLVIIGIVAALTIPNLVWDIIAMEYGMLKMVA